MQLTNNASFLVELDALLDTRLATLLLMDATKVHAMDKASYTGRTDNSILWDIEGFEEHYANRNIETLKAATPTGMVEKLHFLIGTIMRDPNFAFPDRVHRLDVNYYPFILSEEIVNEYRDTFKELYPQVDEVRMVYFSPAQCSPAWIHSRCYDLVVRYDFLDWLAIHNKNLEEQSAPETIMVVPRLRARDKLEEIAKGKHTAISDYIKNGKDFEAFELAFAERVPLRFSDAADFSTLIYYKPA